MDPGSGLAVNEGVVYAVSLLKSAGTAAAFRLVDPNAPEFREGQTTILMGME